MYETASVSSITDSKSQSMSQATGTRKADAPDEARVREQSAQTEVANEQVSKEELKTSIKELNSALKSLNVKREFSLEEESDELVVTIMDSEGKRVIKQIPDEEALKLSKNIKEMVGLLYDNVS